MERNLPGALRAPGAFGASGAAPGRGIGSSCNSLNLLPLRHARLLSRSGAAVFGRGTADDAACVLWVLESTEVPRSGQVYYSAEV
jgi:hypothetical protein